MVSANLAKFAKSSSLLRTLILLNQQLRCTILPHGTETHNLEWSVLNITFFSTVGTHTQSHTHTHTHTHTQVDIITYIHLASFPGLLHLQFWSLAVCKNGGGRLGQSSHAIRGTTVIYRHTSHQQSKSCTRPILHSALSPLVSQLSLSGFAANLYMFYR